MSLNIIEIDQLRGVLTALIDTVESTTDLESVYSKVGNAFSWATVKSQLTMLDEARAKLLSSAKFKLLDSIYLSNGIDGVEVPAGEYVEVVGEVQLYNKMVPVILWYEQWTGTIRADLLEDYVTGETSCCH